MGRDRRRWRGCRRRRADHRRRGRARGRRRSRRSDPQPRLASIYNPGRDRQHRAARRARDSLPHRH
ncbi:MAG: hypothetical protein DME08_26730 [Candidatus Rokuibacteriota bacterium]|nr:MAG: hypothetical protein DME08_26730 [Candidatus Rokubacteria bacterium]PYO03910.1 MAG: hypothetical protein DMD89_00855 [Candidatus Rokubacteria bacterium]